MKHLGLIFVILLAVACGSSSTTNTTTITNSSQGKPDLIVVDNPNNVSPSDNIAVGETTFMYFGIKNIGNSSSIGSIFVSVSGNTGDSIESNLGFFNISPGQTVYSNGQISLTAENKDIGIVSMTVFIDSKNDIEESDETNNTSSSNLIVRP